MTHYAVPLDDMRFALFDVAHAEKLYQRLPGCEEASRELVDAVLEEAAHFTEQVLAPLNQTGDEEGCHFDKSEHAVITPQGFKEAYAQFVASGWSGLNAPEIYGGQDLPESVGTLVKEMIDSANVAWGTYPLLSTGATDALLQHGEEWQRQAFLKPIVAGRWTGTMCLTEPHCGSDLGLLKTHAEPTDKDHYLISGTKIFITAGEHDLTENIVHLVLARLPDAPAGTRGISMFLVPKFKVDRDGHMGERNAVQCGSIEHKMGIKGSATCVMNFDAAEGYLIGQAHHGLRAMFTMMNAARLAVGIQGLSLIERAYQNSLSYARERLQMRALTGPKYPDQAADPLMVHPDIRRMLLTQKAFAEGGRALVAITATLADIVLRTKDKTERETAEQKLSFLIPIVKGMLTEVSIECTNHAMQIFGGHGYITDNGMEQLARDARITTIYEGTTQIQALDLLGRKIFQLQGVGLKLFLDEIGAFCKHHSGDTSMAEFITPLAAKAQEWSVLTQTVGKAAAGNPDELGAASVDYLYYSGYIVLAYCWARSVAAAESGKHSDSFKEAKRRTARFYFQRILPRTTAHAGSISAGAASLMEMPDSLFG